MSANSSLQMECSLPDEQFPKSICSCCGNLIRSSWAIRLNGRLFHTACAYLKSDDVQDAINTERSDQQIVCYECREIVMQQTYKRIGERNYHSQCLKCAGCQQRFAEEACYEMGDKNYCYRCQWAHRTDGLLLTDETRNETGDERRQ